MRRILAISGIAVTLTAAGLGLIGPGVFWRGFLAAWILLALAAAALITAWRWAGSSKKLALQTGLAFGLRLGVGVLLMLLLPVIGFADSQVNQAGYSYLDAYNRDGQAWNLADSHQSLTAAFTQEYSTDQYGGMLSLSAAIYRGLSPDAHRQWLILIVTALVSALGVPFLSKGLANHFDEKTVNLAVWIYALYPEALLLGGAQMRDPLLMGLSAMLLWVVSDWRRLGWKALPVGAVILSVMMAFSWLVALPVAGMAAVWWWIDFSSELGRIRLKWLGWLVIIIAGLAALVGMAAWLRESALWDGILTVRESGKLSLLFERMPAYLRDPFIWVYGVLQPVLPAAIFDPSVPVWTTVSILRALGWYALLPLLIFGVRAAMQAERGQKRNLLIFSSLFSFLWIFISSFRAGGDLWDNPRYRTLLLPLLALTAAWGWVSGREKRDAWLGRIAGCEGVFLLVFSFWYAGRSIPGIPALAFGVVVEIIAVGWAVILVYGWVSDALRNGRVNINTLALDQRLVWQSFGDLSLMIVLTSLLSLWLPAAYFGESEVWFSAMGWHHRLIPALTALAGIIGYVLARRTAGKPLFILLRQIVSGLNQQPLSALIVAGLSCIPLAAIQLSAKLIKIRPYLPPMYLFGWGVVLMSLVLWSFRPYKSVRRAIMPALSVFTLVYLIVLQLPRITNYPFSLDWSEGSRIYEASQIYSLLVYGIQLPLPLLDAGRAILQGIPFLLPGLPIAAHRFWLLALELGTALGTALMLARRLQLRNKANTAFFVVWTILFLYQGPVFPHLIVITWLVLWQFDERSPWRNLIWVILASLWAGITRINWFPVAGSLAAILYLTSTIQDKKQPWWRYLLPPAVYLGAGSLTALVVYLGYIRVSGNPSGDFGTSLNSTLIWERLWPNASFGLGILPGILLVSLPLLAMTAAHCIRCRGAWKPLRVASIGAILLVFFAGGVIVSLKIGGGNNLHNLDAFLVLLLVACSLILSERFMPDTPRTIQPVQWTAVWLGLAVILPVAFTLFTQRAVTQPTQTATSEALAYIQKTVEQANEDNEAVLWMSERQLLAFHNVPYTQLIPEYERVVIAEMAMAGNDKYFETYRDALAAKQFGVIIVEPLRIEYIDEQSNLFAQENNRFVDEIFTPLDQNYHARRIFKTVGVAVMTPKAAPRP